LPRFPVSRSSGSRSNARLVQRTILRHQRLAMGRPSSPRPSCRCPHVLCALMGAGTWRLRLAVLDRLHGAREVRNPLYASMLIFIAGFVGLVYSAKPLHLLPLLGTGWDLCLLQSRRLLLHQQRSRPRRTQSPADDPHRRLRIACRDPRYLPPHRQRPVDRSPRCTRFTGGVFLLMLAALVAKYSARFHWHTWIPEAMAAPTPVSALLHAAC
jgi:hypothetical protein